MPNDLSAGAIAGIVIGGLFGTLFLLMAVGGVVLCCEVPFSLWPKRNARRVVSDIIIRRRQKLLLVNGHEEKKKKKEREEEEEEGARRGRISATQEPLHRQRSKQQQTIGGGGGGVHPPSSSSSSSSSPLCAIVSHRGGSINAPENTMAAFKFAVEVGGASMLELDVGLSADGIPIVFHDEELARVVDGAWLAANPEKKRISDLVVKGSSRSGGGGGERGGEGSGGEEGEECLLPPTASVIPLHFSTPTLGAYRAPRPLRKEEEEEEKEEGVKIDTSGGEVANNNVNDKEDSPSRPPHHYHHHDDDGHRPPRVCTLEELLRWCPADVILHIDLKHTAQPVPDRLIDTVLDLVCRHRAPGTTILGSVFPTNSRLLYRAKEQRRNLHGCVPTVVDEHSCYGCCSCCCCCCCCVCCCCSVCAAEGSTQEATEEASSSDVRSSPLRKQQKEKKTEGDWNGDGDDKAAATVKDNTQVDGGNTAHGAVAAPSSPSSPSSPPAFYMFAGLAETVLTLLLFYTGLLPYWRIPYDCYSCPFPSDHLVSRIAPNKNNNKGSLRQKEKGGGGRTNNTSDKSTKGVWLKRLLLTPKLWSHLRQRGVLVFFWVLNTDDEFEQACVYPHDGIMTDDTVGLAAFVEKRAAGRGGGEVRAKVSSRLHV